MKQGRLMRDTTLPKLTVTLKSFVSSTITLLASKLPKHPSSDQLSNRQQVHSRARLVMNESTLIVHHRPKAAFLVSNAQQEPSMPLTALQHYNECMREAWGCGIVSAFHLPVSKLRMEPPLDAWLACRA